MLYLIKIRCLIITKYYIINKHYFFVADIFLERRSENSIHRNALVSVFLRLLEYHQGILFLTTNRGRNLWKNMFEFLISLYWFILNYLFHSFYSKMF
jgi:hypothetical protein